MVKKSTRFLPNKRPILFWPQKWGDKKVKKQKLQTIIELEKWLSENNLHCLRIEILGNDDEIRWYSKLDKILIIQFYANGNGWEVFLRPNGIGNNTKETLKRMSEYLK